MRDELSIYFENPATDPLGYEQVEGKLVCDRDGVTMRFKQRDRAFRKNDGLVLELSYSEIESVNYASRFFGPKVDLHVVRSSRSEATKVANFVEYRQSEAFLREQDDRLSESRESLDL